MSWKNEHGEELLFTSSKVCLLLNDLSPFSAIQIVDNSELQDITSFHVFSTDLLFFPSVRITSFVSIVKDTRLISFIWFHNNRPSLDLKDRCEEEYLFASLSS
ncbi:hypothetical protein Droror1_Dr00010967 [Drosera rotundifolia]